MGFCLVHGSLYWRGIGLARLPAATLGLMVATEQAASGKFPMPTVMLVAFRAGQLRLKAMLLLGVLYALSFLAVMAISALVDGGGFAKVYLANAPITPEVVNDADFQAAMWLTTILYVPLSMLFGTRLLWFIGTAFHPQKPVFQRNRLLAQFWRLCCVFVGMGRRVCGGRHGHPPHQQRLRWQRFISRRSHARRIAHGGHVFRIGLL